MLEREEILEVLWRRMSEVSGVSYTVRNPEAPPGIDDLPAVQIFELGDEVVKVDSRGGYPAYTRRLSVALEGFIKATKEEAASKEIMAFLLEIKKKLYEGGPTLGKRCLLVEKSASRVLRPPAGEHSVGIGVALEIQYVEDTSKLF